MQLKTKIKWILSDLDGVIRNFPQQRDIEIEKAFTFQGEFLLHMGLKKISSKILSN